MKKKYIYPIFIVVFIGAIIGIVYKQKAKEKVDETKVYRLVDRKGPEALTEEWKKTKIKGDKLADMLENNPTDTKTALHLAQLFIEESRITGNHLYYDKAAMKTVNDILKRDTAQFEALVYKSLLYMSQHHFADGLATAQKAQRVNPYNAYIYGLMVDGNVEMGNYDSAVANADKMVSVRPDLTSYSRISYVREIYGNYKGAIDAMKMAVEAGPNGDEYTEWSRAQLAALYEKTGDYKTAELLYETSLVYRNNYPFALAGLARIAVANNDYNKAIGYYQKADSLITDFTIQEELSNVYRLSGQTKKADELEEKIIAGLNESAQAGNNDESIGHYSDRELAYAYLTINNKEDALKHALLEYNRRPENIDVNETVAWVYYNKGEYDKALPYIKKALRTNSKNPVLLNRAALIFYKTGDKTMAKSMLTAFSPTNPYIDLNLRKETSAIMQSL